MPRSRYLAVVAGLSRQEVADRAGVPFRQVGRSWTSASCNRRRRIVHGRRCPQGAARSCPASKAACRSMPWQRLSSEEICRSPSSTSRCTSASPQLSDRTFQEVSGCHGIPLELLKVVREAIGFARPGGEDLVREGELLVVPLIEFQLTKGIKAAVIERWLASTVRACASWPARVRHGDTGGQDLSRLRLQQLVDLVRTEPLRHHHE
jgi:hypothetical protein